MAPDSYTREEVDLMYDHWLAAHEESQYFMESHGWGREAWHAAFEQMRKCGPGMPQLPEDVRSFIYEVTLHLQSYRSKSDLQHTNMFQDAYRLYAKYDVEGWQKRHDATGD